MNETNMGVILELKDQASPRLKAFGKQVRATSVDVQHSSTEMNQSLGGIGDSLVSNKQAFMEMSSGVRYMGTTMLALGVAMQMSNNETLKGIGNMVMMTGAIMTVVGSAAGFIGAIGQMINALKALRIQQILTQAFAGPAGWIALAGGAAVAAGVLYGVSRAEGGQAKTVGAATQNVTINQNIHGSVVSDRQLTDSVQKGLLEKGGRNYSTGIK